MTCNLVRRCNLFALIVFVFTIFSSCDMRQSINQDLTTGAQSRGDGLSCQNVEIEINGKVESRNEFVYGEKVNLIFNDVQGLTKKNGKTFPGMSVYVVSNTSDTVLSEPDVLPEMVEGTTLFPLKLTAFFNALMEYKDGQEYTVHAKIWDRKGDGTFTYEMPFTIVPNDVLTIEENGLEFASIYLWDETEKLVVANKKVNQSSTLMLLLDEVKGMSVQNGMSFPALSLQIVDDSGNEILFNENLLSQFATTGVREVDLTEGQLHATITFTEGSISNPCKLKAVLSDLKSDKKIEVKGELVIQD